MRLVQPGRTFGGGARYFMLEIIRRDARAAPAMSRVPPAGRRGWYWSY